MLCIVKSIPFLYFASLQTHQNMSTKIKRLFDFAYYAHERYGLSNMFVTKYNGEWKASSSSHYLDQVNALSRGLLRLGVQPNDKIAIISSNNRTEWNVTDCAVLQVGAQDVPIYPTIAKEDYEYILNHSEATFCFASDASIVEKLNQIKGNTKLKGVYTFDELEGEQHWSEVLSLGEDSSNQADVQARMDAVTADDLATIIYTSGTTGRPKGVMLSHGNIVSNTIASEERVPLDKGNSVALSFLPVCHIFERMILYLYQYCGVEIHFAESIETMSDNLKEVKPHIMTAVPRLYEKVFDKIYAKGAELSGIKQKLFYWAIEVGLVFEPYGANGWWYEKKLAIARKLILSKMKEGMGGRLDFMVSGSAALQPRLSRFFAAAEMPIMEGYGLTETSPVISVNDQNNKGFKIGTVGRIVKGVTVKIAEDGEILCKGPNVMQGYYKDPEKTAEVMTGEYFHTGDIGEIDSNGFLKITDRKKEMFKTSGGKYVAPSLLEGKLKQSRFIEQIMVVGEGEKMPAALIQPNFAFIKEWIELKGYKVGTTPDEIATSTVVKERIQKEVDECNVQFGKWEQIKKFELTPDEWTIDGGHLTPTMKMKRKVIKEIYLDLYEKIYRG